MLQSYKNLPVHLINNLFISKNKDHYNLLIKTRVKNKRTNLGKTYFENTYIITISNIKAKVT